MTQPNDNLWERLAQLLKAHRFDDGGGYTTCRCGFQEEPGEQTWDEHCIEQLDPLITQACNEARVDGFEKFYDDLPQFVKGMPSVWEYSQEYRKQLEQSK